MSSTENDLIHDWNIAAEPPSSGSNPILILDETLRDGLQSPSVTHPQFEEKCLLLQLMHRLGITTANLGYAGAGPHFSAEVARLAQTITENHWQIQPQSAGRTAIADVEAIARASQKAGVAIEAGLFIGSSPVRQYVEDWTLDQLCVLVERAVTFAVRQDLPVMFVTEDTTRSNPAHLRALYHVALNAGATRICLADTVGHATPTGVRTLLTFVKGIAHTAGVEVGIDWHGHRDRGLDLVNALTALENGATRIHACALGIGERSGNTPMELLLVNLRLLGLIDNDLSSLQEYVELVARTTNISIPPNQPIVGQDAFRTATGTHAAAISKALRRGDEWLANAVFSSIPADMIGRRQQIEIGPLSGLHNVRFWLESNGLEAGTECVDAILAAAKASKTILTESDVRLITARFERNDAYTYAPLNGTAD